MWGYTIPPDADPIRWFNCFSCEKIILLQNSRDRSSYLEDAKCSGNVIKLPQIMASTDIQKPFAKPFSEIENLVDEQIRKIQEKNSRSA